MSPQLQGPGTRLSGLCANHLRQASCRADQHNSSPKSSVNQSLISFITSIYLFLFISIPIFVFYGTKNSAKLCPTAQDTIKIDMQFKAQTCKGAYQTRKSPFKSSISLAQTLSLFKLSLCNQIIDSTYGLVWINFS